MILNRKSVYVIVFMFSQSTEIVVHMFNLVHIFLLLKTSKITEKTIKINAVNAETYRNTNRSPGGSEF